MRPALDRITRIMPQIRAEQRHPGRDITAVAIPVKQRLDSKTVTEIGDNAEAGATWSKQALGRGIDETEEGDWREPGRGLPGHSCAEEARV
jgi:hypothetical protein